MLLIVKHHECSWLCRIRGQFTRRWLGGHRGPPDRRTRRTQLSMSPIISWNVSAPTFPGMHCAELFQKSVIWRAHGRQRQVGFSCGYRRCNLAWHALTSSIFPGRIRKTLSNQPTNQPLKCITSRGHSWSVHMRAVRVIRAQAADQILFGRVSTI